MKKIKMKIVDWDQENLNLIVKFSSDDMLKNVDDATPLAYQPITMFPGIDDVEEIAKRLAVSGIHVCEMEKTKEEALQNLQLKNDIGSLVGKTLEYDVDYLLNMHKDRQLSEEDFSENEYEDLVQEDSKIKTIDV
jgi:hypothetical protein